MLAGIDVSHYQGEIDWSTVAQSGIGFAWIKATDGLALDPRFYFNSKKASDAGIPVGYYHFWRPQIDWLQQAKTFLSALRGFPVPFATALDIETGALTEEKQQDGLDWLAFVNSPTGAIVANPCVVYVSPSYADLNLTDSAWLGYQLWTAHYTELAQPRTSRWSSWTFWQHSARGIVPGVPNPVDLDWFNGEAADLSRWTQNWRTAAQPPATT